MGVLYNVISVGGTVMARCATSDSLSPLRQARRGWGIRRVCGSGSAVESGEHPRPPGTVCGTADHLHPPVMQT